MHSLTPRRSSKLANMLSGQGKYEQAEEMHQRVLELRETVLGKEHPDTLMSMNNLANVLSDQGKYEQAEEMHQRGLELSKAGVEISEVDTLMRMNNMANRVN